MRGYSGSGWTAVRASEEQKAAILAAFAGIDTSYAANTGGAGGSVDDTGGTTPAPDSYAANVGTGSSATPGINAGAGLGPGKTFQTQTQIF